MSRFLLVRHAETDATGRRLAGRAPGIHLNARGRAQAAALVERLHGIAVDEIRVSPLERTRETVEPLAGARGLEIRELELLEELDYGEWQGMDPEVLSGDPYWEAYNRCRSLYRIPGGESLAEAQLRMVRALESLHARYPRTCVLLGGHGDPIRALLAHLMGAPLDLAIRIEIAPASVSVVDLRGGDVRVRCINATGGPVFPGAQGPAFSRSDE